MHVCPHPLKQHLRPLPHCSSVEHSSTHAPAPDTAGQVPIGGNTEQGANFFEFGFVNNQEYSRKFISPGIDADGTVHPRFICSQHHSCFWIVHASCVEQLNGTIISHAIPHSWGQHFLSAAQCASREQRSEQVRSAVAFNNGQKPM
jgi:hypothetical protein